MQLHQGHDHACTICGFSPALGRDSVLRVQTAVLIAGDPLMVEALTAGLAGQDDLHLVGTATSGSQALAIAETRRVDVAVIDTELGREDGIHVGRMLREVSPATNVIHLSGLADDVGRVTVALQDGVRGWVGKDESVQALLAALRGVQHGETRLPPALLTQVLGRLTPGQPGPLDMLSSRQREVLQGLVDGLSRAAIGERLFVSKNTVRTHIQQLLGRLGAHSVLEAVAMAREAGMRAQSTPALPAGHPGAWPRAATSQAS
ncbi:MAG: response regulator transcription factor [Frankiaceae bacterium]